MFALAQRCIDLRHKGTLYANSMKTIGLINNVFAINSDYQLSN